LSRLLQSLGPFLASMLVTAMVGVFAWIALQSTAPVRDALAGGPSAKQSSEAGAESVPIQLAQHGHALLIGVVTVVFFVVAARVALRLRDARREAAVVQLVRSLGGEALFDFQAGSSGHFWQRHLLGRFLPDYYVGRLVSIDLSGSTASDQDIESLGTCQQLTELDLSETAMTADGLKSLARFSRLRSLNLRNLPISDPDLSVLVGMRGLRQLDLQGCSVTAIATANFSTASRIQLVENEQPSEPSLESEPIASIS